MEAHKHEGMEIVIDGVTYALNPLYVAPDGRLAGRQERGKMFYGYVLEPKV